MQNKMFVRLNVFISIFYVFIWSLVNVYTKIYFGWERFMFYVTFSQSSKLANIFQMEFLSFLKYSLNFWTNFEHKFSKNLQSCEIRIVFNKNSSKSFVHFYELELKLIQIFYFLFLAQDLYQALTRNYFWRFIISSLLSRKIKNI